MRIIWLILALLLAAGAYIYFNPDYKSRLKDLSSEVGLGKQAQRVYKWQDTEGKWHITDQLPPEGTAYETLDYPEDVNVLPLPPQLRGE